jgi:hypothetical protein
MLPAQQPVGQDVASHTQAPATQRCPAPHATPAPHMQLPVAEQPSDVVAPQVRHALPAVPQCMLDVAVTQVAPTQQPLGQDWASHTHAPARQRWPAPHTALVPHMQVPPAQLSARAASHATHRMPPVPQLPAPGALHVGPVQQPSGQVETLQPLQRPVAQVSGAGQASHWLPPPPQAAGSVPATQAPFWQQPVAHDVASHTQVLPLQRWPAAQVAPTPQRQSPSDEQLSAR